MKRVGIIQSNYIPWNGYFDFIKSVDEFILLDDVQFTRRDWRNRNKIRTPYGDRWLSIPLKQSGNYEAPINEMEVCDPLWMKDHFNQISGAYRTSKNFKKYEDELEWTYIDSPVKLSLINRSFIELGMKWLKITTKLTWSTDYPSSGSKSSKLVSLLKACGATHYLSGPAARNYLDESLFATNGLAVEWMQYKEHPKLSFLHSIFNEPRFS